MAAGDIRICIDPRKLWTPSGIWFKNRLMGVEDSAYGTVIDIKGVGFIGSTHCENETEQVDQLQFTLDDEPLSKPEPTIVGRSVVLDRRSTAHGVHYDSRLQIDGPTIIQSVEIRNSRELDVSKLYPLMYPWTPNASKYVFCGKHGGKIEGIFLADPGARKYIIEKTAVEWVSVFDPTTNIGTVTRVIARPPGRELWLQIADVPGIYRKLYLVAFPEQVIPASFEGKYSVATRFFDTAESSWVETANVEAVALESFILPMSEAGPRNEGLSDL